MTRILYAGLALVFFISAPLFAQTYPDPSSTTVNDFANLIGAQSEAELVAELEALRDETGVVMTVVTLGRKDLFSPDQSVEQFAKGLFNQWKIGDATKNDGVLFLVLHSDRETRIELGEAYGHNWQVATEIVINRSALPAFKTGDFDKGIRDTVTDAIELIVKNHLAGNAAPKLGAATDSLSAGQSAPTGNETPKKGGLGAWWAAIFAAPFAGLIGWGILKSKLARCSNCGNRGLKVTRNRLEEPTETQPGRGETITECESCGHVETKTYKIPVKRKKETKPDMGGGDSGGGGATGKW